MILYDVAKRTAANDTYNRDDLESYLIRRTTDGKIKWYFGSGRIEGFGQGALFRLPNAENRLYVDSTGVEFEPFDMPLTAKFAETIRELALPPRWPWNHLRGE